MNMGGLHDFAPYVLRPSNVPEVFDEAEARENPELAVLSAIAHGRDAPPERAAEIALVAQKVTDDLDADRKTIYFDLILQSLSEAARKALGNMKEQTYEFRSDFALRHFKRGTAQLVLELLATRFGPLSEENWMRVRLASVEDLRLIGTRLLSAQTLEEALGAVESAPVA